ncbi:hypothetical protein [Listeria seeligeri]|uniref:hypothetical protein n=1 Tax=Listeria seeligeri TaxID=1640 RepID=UPI0022EA5F6C|nr:hypothetical protein [Listeria seeligeri]
MYIQKKLVQKPWKIFLEKYGLLIGRILWFVVGATVYMLFFPQLVTAIYSYLMSHGFDQPSFVAYVYLYEWYFLQSILIFVLFGIALELVFSCIFGNIFDWKKTIFRWLRYIGFLGGFAGYFVIVIYFFLVPFPVWFPILFFIYEIILLWLCFVSRERSLIH